MVLAIVAIITAIAAPAMLPMLRATQLQGAAAEVAAFVELARRSAVTSGRCQRIIEVGGALRQDELSSPDCVNLIDPWNTGRRTFRAEPMVTLTFNGQALAGVPDDEALIFRPSGRLRGDADLDTSDDGMRIIVQVSGIADQARIVRITPTGRICVLTMAEPVPASSSPMVCP